jgi:hypothetical protein
MTVNTKAEAWAIAHQIIKNAEKDTEASERTGYPIHKGEGGYICDLEARLEVNTDDGGSINIWIGDDWIGDDTTTHTATTTADRQRGTIRTYVDIVAETTHTTANRKTITTATAYLTIDGNTTFDDLKAFEKQAKNAIREAKTNAKNGDFVRVTASVFKAKIDAWRYIVIDSNEWTGEGDQITAKGVHLEADPILNRTATNSLYLTGKDIFAEMSAIFQ